MKKLVVCLLILAFASANAQIKSFRFAFISDTHIGSPNGSAEEDLRRTVVDINQMTDIAFVILTGDITELGTTEEIKKAKTILSELKVPYYIIPGNHDTGWSETGGVAFTQIFGYDKFIFEHNGITFIGCASGPYVRMSDGHIPRDAVNWLDRELKKLKNDQPIVFLNHYPLDNGLDNWYEAIDRLKKKNTIAALCGHGHANKAMNFEGIPAVMGRSNLRAKAEIGGYNLVDVRADSMIFSERRPGLETRASWTGIRITKQDYQTSPASMRPSYAVNDSFPNVQVKWVHHSPANVISTPATDGKLVIFGNSMGTITAVDKVTGKQKWKFQTQGSVFSSPAIAGKQVIMGSGDGWVYCLQTNTGKLIWKYQTGAAVLGSPLIENNKVYIGASDHYFRALELTTGKEIWRFGGLNGPVMSKPVMEGEKIIFGAWDRNLYALNKNNGQLIWQWSNGSTVLNFSPAACIPVIADDVVYVVAPDRYISAIDLETGKTLWRNNEATVRESIGISADGKYVYGKTMNDIIVAFPTSREKQSVAWKVNCGFGYEHVPSMLIEKDQTVVFGTKSGRVYAIDPIKQEKKWVYKIDNSMVNTVNMINGKQIIAATMDGKVTLLEVKE
ncbi:MAG: PQQ-binding-like beta-propeller repeat protein [Chitinophagaceae bacterium]|nr:PQQ-binding-like beta-propeller repeat protein [Chitinophagaceae bacterium]